MTLSLSILAAGVAVILVGCTEPATTTTTTSSRTTSSTNTDGREAGSADPLSRYRPSTVGEGNANSTGVAGRGTSALPTSNTVPGGR